jgi:V8-like Glu-specific endopeptidase
MPLPMQKVANPADAPYSSVFHQEITRRRPLTRTFNSTGFLLGPKRVGTAAHNVANYRVSWLQYGIMRAGRSGEDWVWEDDDYFGPDDVRVGRGYSKWGQDYPNDYGLIRLVGSAPVVPAFRLPTAAEWQVAVGTPLEIAGFPGDTQDGQTMYHATMPLAAVDERFLYYDVDTEVGVSGAPVWTTTASGERIVVGVHVGGQSYEGRDYAIARRMEPVLLEEMNRWLTEP